MQRYRLFLFLFEKFSGLLHIFLDGGLERLHRFKLHFRTQELMQLHMDHLAVQIARKVEQMRLNGRCTAVQKCRLYTDIGRCDIALSVHQNAGCVHAVRRQRRAPQYRKPYTDDRET